jgi:NMD protein affecting ribosome stability and mRNA decay
MSASDDYRDECPGCGREAGDGLRGACDECQRREAEVNERKRNMGIGFYE